MELMFSLNWKRLHPLPSSSDLDGLPYPRVRWYPLFFRENDRKGCKRDYLYALVTFFSVLERPGENRKGVATTPLG